jgi:outer membrane protein TolC
LSEHDAVVRALEGNSAIRVTRIRTAGDSLRLAKAKTGWLPEVTLSAGQAIVPHDSSAAKTTVSAGTDSIAGLPQSLSRSESSRSAATSAAVEARQALPGGAILSGHIEAARGVDLDAGQAGYSSTAGIGLTQPLLRGAFDNATPGYTIKVASLAHAEATLREKKDILAAISDVRRRYWDVYEKKVLGKVYLSQREHARKQLEAARARFSIGKNAELDTLSAALDLLRSSQRVLSNQTDLALARRALSVALGADTAVLTISAASPVGIDSLPDPERLLAMARRFDPELRIFETARERLGITRRFQRNQLLPRLDLHLSAQRDASGNMLFGADNSLRANAVIELVASYSLPRAPRRLDIAQTELALQQQRLEEQEYRRQLMVSVEQLSFAWEKERQALAIAREAARIARRRLEAARAGYELGSQNWLALSESRTDYLQAATESVQKEIAMKKLEITFDEITGAVLDRFGIEVQ